MKRALYDLELKKNSYFLNHYLLFKLIFWLTCIGAVVARPSCYWEANRRKSTDCFWWANSLKTNSIPYESQIKIKKKLLHFQQEAVIIFGVQVPPLKLSLFLHMRRGDEKTGKGIIIISLMMVTPSIEEKKVPRKDRAPLLFSKYLSAPSTNLTTPSVYYREIRTLFIFHSTATSPTI